MNVIVRLYWQHDLDLIALAKHPDFEVGRWMKKAVIAFVRGDDSFVIPLPRPQPYQIKLVNCDTHFALSYKESDVIDFFKNFRYGVRNSAIKQIFRMYLERPNFQVFYDDPIYVTKARGKSKKRNISSSNKIKDVESLPPLNKDGIKKVIRDSSTMSTHNNTSAVTSKPLDETPSIVKEEICMKAKNEVPEELDLSKEENDNVEGTSFNLFAAVDKLL